MKWKETKETNHEGVCAYAVRIWNIHSLHMNLSEKICHLGGLRKPYFCIDFGEIIHSKMTLKKTKFEIEWGVRWLEDKTIGSDFFKNLCNNYSYIHLQPLKAFTLDTKYEKGFLWNKWNFSCIFLYDDKFSRCSQTVCEWCARGTVHVIWI